MRPLRGACSKISEALGVSVVWQVYLAGIDDGETRPSRPPIFPPHPDRHDAWRVVPRTVEVRTGGAMMQRTGKSTYYHEY